MSFALLLSHLPHVDESRAHYDTLLSLPAAPREHAEPCIAHAALPALPGLSVLWRRLSGRAPRA